MLALLRLTISLVWIGLSLAPAISQEPPSPAAGAAEQNEGVAIRRPKRLTEGQTQLRIGQYERAEHWALRGLVLLSLGRDWHPSAQSIVLDALRSESPTLRVYGLETLARTSPLALPASPLE